MKEESAGKIKYEAPKYHIHVLMCCRRICGHHVQAHSAQEGFSNDF